VTEQDRDWLARMRALARSDAEASREAVSLTYGNWASTGGPWVVVLSTPPATEPLAKEELLNAIDTDRNRLAADAWLDDEEPDRPPEYQPSMIRTNSGDEHALSCTHGPLAAAHLRPGDANVTALVRGLDLTAIRLGPVTDLGPYLRGRDERLDQQGATHQAIKAGARVGADLLREKWLDAWTEWSWQQGGRHQR
jgi:hypothetical protein